MTSTRPICRSRPALMTTSCSPGSGTDSRSARSTADPFASSYPNVMRGKAPSGSNTSPSQTRMRKAFGKCVGTPTARCRGRTTATHNWLLKTVQRRSPRLLFSYPSSGPFDEMPWLRVLDGFLAGKRLHRVKLGFVPGSDVLVGLPAFGIHFVGQGLRLVGPGIHDP